MFFYTYVLLSLADNKLYIGWTDDLKHRLGQHEKGAVTATRSRRPLRLVYFEAGRDRSKAIAREKYLKTGFGRRFLKGRL